MVHMLIMKRSAFGLGASGRATSRNSSRRILLRVQGEALCES